MAKVSSAPGILASTLPTVASISRPVVLDLNRPYFAAKLNANFPQNPRQFGLPLIQGVIALCDAENGAQLALMDSIEITILRTGAATAVAAKYLARPDSKSILICGCGNQGAVSLRAISRLFSLERVFAYDVDPSHAGQFAKEMARELKIEVKAISAIDEAMKEADMCVTCTPSKQFYLKRDSVRPGTFVAAVGADSEDKQELEPALLANNKIVVDILEQCAIIGELHHGLEGNVVTTDEVHAELGEVVAGIKPGRTSSEKSSSSIRLEWHCRMWCQRRPFMKRRLVLGLALF